MLYLWDIRNLDKEVDSIIIDSSINACTPFVYRELKLIYTVGKGETYINIYDYSKNNIQKKMLLNLNIPSIYSVFFNRKCLDSQNLEIDRLARYSKEQNSVYFLSFMINNKEEYYNYLYPNAVYENSFMSFTEWIQKESNNLFNKLFKGNKKPEEKKIYNEILMKDKELNEQEMKLIQLEELKESYKILIKKKEEYEDIIKQYEENLNNSQKDKIGRAHV